MNNADANQIKICNGMNQVCTTLNEHEIDWSQGTKIIGAYSQNNHFESMLRSSLTENYCTYTTPA